MSWFLRVFASATIGAVCALAPWPAVAAASPATPTPLEIAPRQEVDLAYFQQRLNHLGQWRPHPVWGEVWQPDAGGAFRPYFSGRWQFTGDRGWLWISSEPYGDIVYHYGRWLFDLRQGWLWVPGYVWGPSWVAWRQTGGFIGWFPLPPGAQDLSPRPRANPDDLYGYRAIYGGSFQPDAFTGLWTFVPSPGFGTSLQRPYVTDGSRVRDLYRRSFDATVSMQDRNRARLVAPGMGIPSQGRQTAPFDITSPAVSAPAVSPSTDGFRGFRNPPLGQGLPQAGIATVPTPNPSLGIARPVAAPAGLAPPPPVPNSVTATPASIPRQAQAIPPGFGGPQSGAVLAAPPAQSSPPPASGVPPGFTARGGRLLGGIPGRPSP